MPHILTNQMLHCVFSTKKRKKLIVNGLTDSLYSCIDWIAREHGIILLAIGGTSDHIHVLISVPASLSVAKAIRYLKSDSLSWIHDTFPKHYKFEWQNGYGAFSVGLSDFERTVKYIEGQAGHHCSRSFKEEYIELAKEYAVDYDKRYIFE